MRYRDSSLGLSQRLVFEDGTVFERRPMRGRHDSTWREQHKVDGRVVGRDAWWQRLEAKKGGETS
ncbi:MAG: hypothetical protein LBL86_12070 [Coriobacteriales bacterium]|jgi:hypothetical protein|nr:hypothetical protein [Coriobacteriales bacterium]